MWYQIARFELIYRLRRLETYVYFLALFLFSIVAVDFLFEDGLGAVGRNAPVVIAKTMGIVTAFFSIVTSLIMGVAILRDFRQQMAPLLFTKPLSKRDYLLGRFLGSFIVLILVFSALPLGMMVADSWPLAERQLQPFACLVLPTLFCTAGIFFVSGALSRQLIVVYTQGIFLLLLYVLSIQLSRGASDLFWAAFLDPFSFQATSIVTRFWTAVERNSLPISMEGVLLYNRVFWSGVGLLVFLIGWWQFSFQEKEGKQRNSLRKRVNKGMNPLKKGGEAWTPNEIALPKAPLSFGARARWQQLGKQTAFHLRNILQSASFWAIVLCAVGIMFSNSISLGTVHGVDSYPVSFVVVEELQELSVLFLLLIMLFYTSELVWQARELRMSALQDAMPHSGNIQLLSQLLALGAVYVLLMVAMIVAGVLFQVSQGYYVFEWPVYFTHFFVGTLPFLLLFTVVCFFFQVVCNRKYVALVLAVLFFLLATVVIRKDFGWTHPLLRFAGGDLMGYSAMNAYGHFLAAYLWIKLYWAACAGILLAVAMLLQLRGKETHWRRRITQASTYWRASFGLRLMAGSMLLLMATTGTYMYYQIHLKNVYSSLAEEAAYRAAYEQELGHLAQVTQAEIIAVDLHLELYPSTRSYEARGSYTLRNNGSEALTEIRVQGIPNPQLQLDSFRFSVAGHLDSVYAHYRHYRYQLAGALLPGDSLDFSFRQSFVDTDFGESPQTRIVENGTFLDNFHFPSMGYLDELELEDVDLRQEHGLAPKARTPALHDVHGRQEGRAGGDGEEIRFAITIGTAADQLALAPGELRKHWQTEARAYFRYEMAQPMSNFYAITSGRYYTWSDCWEPAPGSPGQAVDLEIYYHPGHEYNLERMMAGMRASLDYYSQQLGPYPYGQVRIMEFPNYENKAQSFPTAIPFSEGIGFIMNIDSAEVDMAFFITAHELAHQWWGHQLNAAHVQGQYLLMESLAQYSAIMVLAAHYPSEQVQRLLAAQQDRYWQGRARETQTEHPLTLVESGQEYIYYHKGLVNFYNLQAYISADSVNLALRELLRDWNSFSGLRRQNTYPSSEELLPYLRAHTPDSLQYLIDDLLEMVTYYENSATHATVQQLPNGQYELQLQLKTQKYRQNEQGEAQAAPLDEWLPIGLYGTNAAGEEVLIYEANHHFVTEETELRILLNEQPTKAGIDPERRLLDKQMEDNMIEVMRKL